MENGVWGDGMSNLHQLPSTPKPLHIPLSLSLTFQTSLQFFLITFALSSRVSVSLAAKVLNIERKK